MKTILLIITTFLIAYNSIDAQEFINTEPTSLRKRTNKKQAVETFGFEPIRIGITPSALANIYPGLQGSVDIGITNRINIPIELAYIHDMFLDEDAFMRGRRFKIGLQVIAYNTESFYIATGVNYLRRVTFAPEFFRWEPFGGARSENSRHYDLISKTGVEGTITMGIKLTDRFTMEFGGGIGTSVHRNAGKLINTEKNSFKFHPILFRAEYDNEELSLYTDDTRISQTPIVTFHLNFCYTLWQR